MTTKKQKREAAEAKRAAFEAQVKADGLRALAADRARRAEKEREFKKKSMAPKMMGMHRASLLAIIDEFEGLPLPLEKRIEILMTMSPEIRKVLSETKRVEDIEQEVLERFAASLKEHLDAADEAIMAPLTMGVGGPKIGMAELKVDGADITMEAYLQTDLKLTSELFQPKSGDFSTARKFQEDLYLGGFVHDHTKPIKRIRLDESQANLGFAEELKEIAYSVSDELDRQEQELIKRDIEENFEPDFGDFLG